MFSSRITFTASNRVLLAHSHSAARPFLDILDQALDPTSTSHSHFVHALSLPLSSFTKTSDLLRSLLRDAQLLVVVQFMDLGGDYAEYTVSRNTRTGNFALNQTFYDVLDRPPSPSPPAHTAQSASSLGPHLHPSELRDATEIVLVCTSWRGLGHFFQDKLHNVDTTPTKNSTKGLAVGEGQEIGYVVEMRFGGELVVCWDENHLGIRATLEELALSSR